MNSTRLDDAINAANRLGLTMAICVGTPDMGAIATLPKIEQVWDAFELGRPHDTHERLCTVVEGVPLCFVCAWQAAGRSDAEYVPVAPRVYLRRVLVRRAAKRFAAGIDEFIRGNAG